MQREKTMTNLEKQLRKEKTFIERKDNEDMIDIAKQLQKEAIEIKEERDSVAQELFFFTICTISATQGYMS